MIDKTKKRHRMRIIIPAYPAFNIYSFIAHKTTSLGPVCVASVVNKMERWDAEVIDENNLRWYGPRDEKGGADHEFLQQCRPAEVVGLYGGLTSTIPRLYEIARFYKEKGAITVAGGQHFVEETIPEAFANGVDYIVRGEAEITIKELLNALENNLDLRTVKGIVFRNGRGEIVNTPLREPLTDFDKFALLDFSLVRYARISVYPVERIRGCGMDCEFCTVKGKPRCASPERLLEQISFLLETRNARHFFIVDDLFGQQRDQTIRFCRLLRDYQRQVGRRLDITVQIRLDKASDSELLIAMRQAGINTVAIGFESPIAEELKAMRKRIKPAEMISLARIYRRFGFLVHGMFIFGYPLEEGHYFTMPPTERFRRFKRFIRQAKIDTIQVLLPVPLPGTQLRERLRQRGRVYPLEDIGWEYYDGNFPLFEPDAPLSAEEMQSAHRKIMSRFYQFKYMFMIGLNIFFFPAVIFFPHNIKMGWRKWYRLWRNNLIRFGGWITLRKWTTAFKKDRFSQKLREARNHLHYSSS
ncbi:MAG: B12-binding domain-containing radical SAM protein [Candidatus Omnitrophica bacterium]|nr:B12-binding domain-containing radical SAM protein [Candidatus Omnitrophota bacterium]MBU4478489.1 B12-binding domain-containing radical SAM protein [Candidatus Omnitrophota bacterium]MCG2704087.1 B12-binding domain-containing radical SAM protein [Candidatus Omnitrophota bacterium]